MKFVGGTKTTAELIAGTYRRVFMTHFFYIRPLDSRTVVLTGLVRDGTILIENGKIRQTVKNFRWNECPLFMHNKIERIGRAEPVVSYHVTPSLRCTNPKFSRLSDAVECAWRT